MASSSAFWQAGGRWAEVQGPLRQGAQAFGGERVAHPGRVGGPSRASRSPTRGGRGALPSPGGLAQGLNGKGKGGSVRRPDMRARRFLLSRLRARLPRLALDHPGAALLALLALVVVGLVGLEIG